MMRIAFIPSAYRTPFALELAHRLEAAGHVVFWFCPNHRWTRWLLNHGVDPARILDITQYASEWVDPNEDTQSAREYLNQIERKSHWRIYDLIASDHLLARRDTDYAIRYLATCARHVQRFIEANEINFVSAELTWAFEQIVGEVCIYLGVTFVRAVDIRIPNDRTAFFRSRLETDIVELRAPVASDYDEARTLLHAYRNRPRRPSYASINFSALQANLGRVKVLTQHVIDLIGDQYDETSRRPLGLIADHSAQLARSVFRSKFGPFEKVDPEQRRPFVLFALHLQPEATIDVMGSPFCNQTEAVQAIARSLPVTHDLYVKEHFVGFGKRPTGAYDALLEIHGVRLIDPYANTFDLIQKAALVVTATGTVAYEASLLRRPAVTMGPTLFDPIVVSNRFNPFVDSVADLLDELAAGKRLKSEDEILGFLAWILAQSVPGIVGDALWQDYTMEPAYVDKVAHGFFTLFEKLNSTTPAVTHEQPRW